MSVANESIFYYHSASEKTPTHKNWTKKANPGRKKKSHSFQLSIRVGNKLKARRYFIFKPMQKASLWSGSFFNWQLPWLNSNIRNSVATNISICPHKTSKVYTHFFPNFVCDIVTCSFFPFCYLFWQAISVCLASAPTWIHCSDFELVNPDGAGNIFCFSVAYGLSLFHARCPELGYHLHEIKCIQLQGFPLKMGADSGLAKIRCYPPVSFLTFLALNFRDFLWESDQSSCLTVP